MGEFHLKAVVMDGVAMSRAITRIAHEIIERNKGANDLALIGIRSRGIFLANWLGAKLGDIEGVPFGRHARCNLLPDDVATHPKVEAHTTEIPFDINNKSIILVDDVLYTGRTVRARSTPSWI